MKVICIDGVKTGVVGERGLLIAGKAEEIYEGETYTVCGNNVVNGKRGYFLSERPPYASYRVERFLPLSEINEMEIVEACNERLLA
jgi:hypothetical protein